MSLMVSFCAVLFPQDVLDEIWDLIESVSGVCVWRGGGGGVERGPAYSCYFCESSYLFYLSFNFDFYVSKIMLL